MTLDNFMNTENLSDEFVAGIQLMHQRDQIKADMFTLAKMVKPDIAVTFKFTYRISKPLAVDYFDLLLSTVRDNIHSNNPNSKVRFVPIINEFDNDEIDMKLLVYNYGNEDTSHIEKLFSDVWTSFSDDSEFEMTEFTKLKHGTTTKIRSWFDEWYCDGKHGIFENHTNFDWEVAEFAHYY